MSTSAIRRRCAGLGDGEPASLIGERMQFGPVSGAGAEQLALIAEVRVDGVTLNPCRLGDRRDRRSRRADARVELDRCLHDAIVVSPRRARRAVSAGRFESLHSSVQRKLDSLRVPGDNRCTLPCNERMRPCSTSISTRSAEGRRVHSRPAPARRKWASRTRARSGTRARRPCTSSSSRACTSALIETAPRSCC